MKWYGPLFLLVFVVAIFLSLKRWQDSPFLVFNEQSFSKEELGLEDKPRLPQEMSAKLYPIILDLLCTKLDCELGLDWTYGTEGEDAYYLEFTESISKLKEQTASMQFQFALLLEQVIMIHKKRSPQPVFMSQLPWIGYKDADWYILIQLEREHILFSRIQQIMQRLTRDYPRLKIFFYPFDGAKTKAQSWQNILCAQQAQSFWPNFINDNLSVFDHLGCEINFSEPAPAELIDKGLEINVMGYKINDYPGYVDFAHLLQVQYLQTKFLRP